MTSSETAKDTKNKIRKKIWDLLEKNDIAKFPRPVYGRIPNFEGAEKAAEKLAKLKEFIESKIIFCNPDSPQRYVRFLALRSGKIVIMATPKLKKGFIILNPGDIPKGLLWEASSIRGAFKYGKLMENLENVKIDLKVAGSVAVTLNGARVGKGGGYSDLEYAILKELGVLDDSTPIATTVHEYQIVKDIPMLEHDVPIDIIVTPSRVIRVKDRIYSKPKGIYWDILPKEKIESIPILSKLRMKENEGEKY